MFAAPGRSEDASGNSDILGAGDLVMLEASLVERQHSLLSLYKIFAEKCK